MILLLPPNTILLYIKNSNSSTVCATLSHSIVSNALMVKKKCYINGMGKHTGTIGARKHEEINNHTR